MKISELPKPLKELALKRQIEEGDDLQTDDLIEAFKWEDTPEGDNYWVNIYMGELDAEITPINETKHEKLMRRLNKSVELHAKAQNYDLSERRVRLSTYLYEKRNKYLRELIYTQIEHSTEKLPFN